MQSNYTTLKNYMFTNFGVMPWIQFTCTPETNDTTSGWTTEAAQSPLNSNFGPAPCTRSYWNQYVLNGTVVSDLAVDPWTSTVQGTNNAMNWFCPGVTGTTTEAITTSPTMNSVTTTDQIPIGQNAVVITAGVPDVGTASGNYQVQANPGGSGNYTLTIQGPLQHAANAKFTTAHASGSTITGSIVSGDGVHPTTFAHNLGAAQLIAAKPAITALAYQ